MRRLWLACFAFVAMAQEKPLVYLTARSQAPSLTMELVKPAGAGPFPVVLLVHGGGFAGGKPSDMRAVAEKLKEAGLASAMVSYRLAPRFQFPSPVQDLKAAVRYLRANAGRLGVTGERIRALGQEAGGTLVELLGATQGVARFEGRAENREFSSAVACVVSQGAIAGTPAFLGVSGTLADAEPRQWRTPDAPPVLREGDPVPFLLRHLRVAADRWTVLLADHGPGAELIAIGWPSERVLWRVPNGSGLDVQALGNGHVLFTDHAAHRVIELDRERKVVWSLGAEAGLVTPFSVRRLGNGNTLVGDAKGARVTEFTSDGKVAWQWAKPESEEAWPRMSRPTGVGTILVASQKGGVVYEIDRAGKTVWEFRIDPARLPYQGVRLGNGNTLIGLVDPGEVIEVDRAGRVVRSIGGAAGALRLGWIAGIDPLPGGGLMIADFTGRRVLEVDGEGKLVAELRDLPWAVASIAVMGAGQ